MLRLCRLLGPDFIDLRPDAREFRFARRVHVLANGKTKGSERNHDAANLLMDVTGRPLVHVVDKLMGFGLCAAIGLYEFQRLFDESMIAFDFVAADFLAEARRHPWLDARLKGSILPRPAG